ncbi:MAG TPA: hypothetical protein VHO69_09915 [Phototrophicaceae bacterium]|nr:hypothetical protein [Phototrophicaceae bacterium]
MAFLGDLYKQVPQAFGIPNLVANTFYDLKNEAGDITETFHILSYWIAEISYFESQRPDNPVVAVILTDRWQKGIFLVPDPGNPPIEKKDLVKPVDLSNWIDPVAAALRHVDLFFVERLGLISEWGYNYNFKFGTTNCFGEFHISSPVDSPSLEELWNALLTTVYHLVNLYDNDDMRTFVSDTPGSRYLKSVKPKS